MTTPRAAALREDLAKLVEAHTPSQLAAIDGVTQRDDEAVSNWFRGVSLRRMYSTSLRADSLGDLPVLMEVARSVFDRTSDATSFRAVRAIYDELKRRKVDTRRVFDGAMLHCLIASQQFEEARAFALTQPRLQAHVPQVVDTTAGRSKGRTVLELDGSGTTLTRRETGELVTSPRDSISFDFVSEWNSAHAAMPITIPFNAMEWKEVDVRAVPQFVIFRRGRALEVSAGGRAKAMLTRCARRSYRRPVTRSGYE